MVVLGRAHTSDLGADDLLRLRELLDGAFEGRFADEDWEHTLDGTHFLLREDAEVVAHAAVVQRRLLYRARAIRTGYVEGLAVRADRRRGGYASAVMSAVERVLAAAYDLGALSDGTGIERFYERRGWLQWRGPTSVLSPEGLQRTPDDDDALFVLPTPTSPELDPSAAIACDWRLGDVW